ncbi:hypothetical protein Ciccas_007190 [Cichlidogyrus casuarinus]|uniref:C2H2-type domain-containing protein n=1 Tax=Cichlidogyrus casuarinus TaxID=1844966 RepID=A0ABD2Q7J5_9PLAT
MLPFKHKGRMKYPDQGISEEFICSYCSEKFTCKSNLVVHGIKEHSQKSQDDNHQCPLCPKSFNRYVAFMNHLTCHTKPEYLTCPQCSFTFANKEKFNEHKCFSHSHYFNKPCHNCGFLCASLGIYRSHLARCDPDALKQKPQPKPIRPPATEHPAISPNVRLTKIKATGIIKEIVTPSQPSAKHSSYQRYSCPVCEQSLKYKHSVKVHLRNVHNIESADQPQLIHSRSASETDPESLVDDSEVALMEKRPRPFQNSIVCPICCLSFKYKSMYYVHRKVHLQEQRLSKMDQCRVQFKTLAEERKCYLRESTKGRNYVCSQCKASYHHKHHFNAHLRQKHPSVLDLTAVQKRSLGRQFTSKRASVLACPKCPYQTLYKVCLHRHMSRHSCEAQYQCPACTRSFRHLNRFRYHAFMFHQDPRLEPLLNSAKSGPAQPGFPQSFAIKKASYKKLTRPRLEANGLYQCVVCSASFRVGWMLLHHAYAEHQQFLPNTDLRGRYSCPYCFVKSLNRKAIRLHCQIHENSVQQCSLCGHVHNSDIHNHIEDAHPPVEFLNIFKCLVCSFDTNDVAILVKHSHEHKCKTRIKVSVSVIIAEAEF